jgi:hypothetical protein
MKIRQEGSDFPTMGTAAVEEIVRRVRHAVASGERSVVLLDAPCGDEGIRGGDREQLRLGFVSRAEALLRNRPERGRILPMIHRYFDEHPNAEDRGPLDGTLARLVLARVLAVRILEHGLRVLVEPGEALDSLRAEGGDVLPITRSRDADVLIRIEGAGMFTSEGRVSDRAIDLA